MLNIIFRSGGTPKQSRPEEDPHESPTKEIAPSNGTAKALRLVYCDDKGKFRMDAEAVAALQLVKGPLGVVAVCGRARQGKSFILNQLLGRSSGFQVGPTHRPCTKGLWMWSIPIKRTSPDGSEYNLLLLDSEGIDAYDQTGTYSTQIFSLAVLLSSMFVYNQMGGIDEAALDRLSLVTEMTKHIRVRASQRRSTTDELGQFSPVFMWLLRDFYLDLKEGQRHITPREYLESALQPMPGSGKAIYAKNEIRESIRSLFPDRHCFTLVRPLNDERDLQRLDQIQMEKMRPEFRTGLDQLTRFIFERTRPKQLGSTVMTGPLFAGLTQSFLDAINAGAVPTIATSWQNVEENECRRAEDLAVEAYTKAFDKSVPPEQMALQETHEAALQIALSVYNNVAVGLGPVRIKYEKSLISVLKKRFEEYKQRVSIEAELKTVKAVDFMEENLRAACHSENVTFDQVIQQLDGLIQEYEKGVFGPAKWQKLAKFLHHSIEGLLGDFVKRIISQANAQYAALEMRFNSLDDKLKLTAKHAEAAHRESLEWKRMYEAALADYKSNADLSASQYTVLQSKLGKLEEQKASLTQQLEAAMKEAFEWQGKYDHIVAEKKTELERQLSEFTALQSRCSAAEARLAAAREQSESAKEEAAEWRRKHDAVVAEARSAAERANVLRERANKQAQLREDAIRAEFSSTVTQKEAGLRELRANLEKSEQAVIDMSTRILNLESKLGTQEDELATVRAELRHAEKVIDTVKSSAATFERQAEAAQQEKTYAEEKLIDLLKKLEELEEASQRFEKEARKAVEEAEAAKELATSAEREKLEALRLAVERLVSIEKFQRISESMGRERDNLAQELEHAKLAEQDALSKAQSVEKRLDEREHEMQELLQTAHEQRASTVHVLEGLLATERAAHAEANARADALSVQLQTVQAKLDSLQKELTTSKLNEAALETKVRAHQADSSGRRKRGSDDNMVSGHDTDTPLNVHQSRRKRMKLDLNADNGSSFGHTAAESDSNARYDEDNGSTDMQEAFDYRKLTVSRLKQELTNAGFGAEVFQARNASKKDILALYTKHVLKK